MSSPARYIRPELLAPAGDMEKLETALGYGADAVYLGGSELSLRSKAGGFSPPDLAKAFNLVRSKGKRSYFCLNILAQEKHLPLARDYLERLADLGPHGPHGLILADPGLIRLAKRITPGLPVHLSTQANTSNSMAAAFWKELGVSRINLSRETDARGVKAVLRNAPGLEIELFVHGAMCMALSGRCLLSAALCGRSANQGLCAHPCRFQYKTTAVMVEEGSRPGRPVWEAVQGRDYSALFAAEDLCLLPFLGWLGRAGVSALKIEGRMKSAGHLAQVLDAYNTALVDLEQGRFRKSLYMEELANAASRPLSTGFFLPRGAKILAEPPGPGELRPIVGKFIERRAGKWLVAVRAPWPNQADVRILVPGLERPLIRASRYCLLDLEGTPKDKVHPGTEILLELDSDQARPGLFIRLDRP